MTFYKEVLLNARKSEGSYLEFSCSSDWDWFTGSTGGDWDCFTGAQTTAETVGVTSADEIPEELTVTWITDFYCCRATCVRWVCID